jgi:hypothetical protein
MSFDYAFDPDNESLEEYAQRLAGHQDRDKIEADIYNIAAEGYFAQSDACLAKAKRILWWQRALLVPAVLFCLLTFAGVGLALFLSLAFSAASISCTYWHRKALRQSREALKNYRELKRPY